MFRVAFVHDPQSLSRAIEAYTLIAKVSTLAEAKEKRVVAGDLVFDAQGNIVQSREWLWPWEHKKETCYAKQAQAMRYRIGHTQEAL